MPWTHRIALLALVIAPGCDCSGTLHMDGGPCDVDPPPPEWDGVYRASTKSG